MGLGGGRGEGGRGIGVGDGGLREGVLLIWLSYVAKNSLLNKTVLLFILIRVP